MSDDSVLQSLEAAIISFNEELSIDLVREALQKKIDPFSITDTLSGGLKAVGDQFADGKCFIPELIFSGEIFKKAMEMVEPALKGRKTQRIKAKVVIGTVKGDLHDLGLKLVALTLFMDGFEVVNLGKDVAGDTFIEKVKELKPQVLGLSALLTTTLNEQKAVITSLEQHRLRDTVKVMIGGAPVTREWADAIGADAVGFDAIDALEKINKLVG